MSDEYGSDFITITDEDGKEYELEHLDTIEVGDAIYMAFLPTDSGTDSEEPEEMIILKVIEVDGEQIFKTIDDDDELEQVYGFFMEQLFDDSEDSADK